MTSMMRDCVCGVCGYRETTAEYEPECPKCHDGWLCEIQLDCKCGKAYSLNDIEDAGSRDPEDNDIMSRIKLTYVGSSNRHWNYGNEGYDWTEFYRCICGETLEFDTGW